MGGQRERPPLGRSLAFRPFSAWIAAEVREALPNVYAIRRTPRASWSFRGWRVTLDAATDPWVCRVCDARGRILAEIVDARHDGHSANEAIATIVRALSR
jgi:hypothetical protein